MNIFFQQPYYQSNNCKYSTIYTTLLECLKSKQSKIVIIYIDLPIWIEAICIGNWKYFRIWREKQKFQLQTKIEIDS